MPPFKMALTYLDCLGHYYACSACLWNKAGTYFIFADCDLKDREEKMNTEEGRENKHLSSLWSLEVDTPPLNINLLISQLSWGCYLLLFYRGGEGG
jgi:hypothetical protein